MASSHDAHAASTGAEPFDYDILADVSQHGASVFDFLSQPNMFTAPTASPSLAPSPLHTTRPDHPMTAFSLAPSIPDISMHIVPPDSASPQMASESTMPHDLSLSTSPPPPIPRRSSDHKTPTLSKKKRGSPAASDSKLSVQHPHNNFTTGYAYMNQAESFCTTDSVPNNNKSMPVALAISKSRGGGGGATATTTAAVAAAAAAATTAGGGSGGAATHVRASRSTSSLPVLMDASTTEPGGSVHSPSAVDEMEPGKDVHNSHTRRCRAKVNSKFQELLRILPTPPPKTGVKHKAQILDYTIRVFREIYAKKLYLEAELALSSRAHLNMWVDSIVKPATRLADILNPFMSLICTKEKWQFAETWVPFVPTTANGCVTTDATSHDVNIPYSPTRPNGTTTAAATTAAANGAMSGGAGGGSSGVSQHPNASTPAAAGSTSHLPAPPVPDAPLRLGTTVIPNTGNFDDPDLQSKLERFRDRSRPYTCKPRVDPPGRIMCTMRPEWLPSLADEEAFQRASLAREASLSVCFGVPFFVRGHVVAVVVFFDVEQRAYDAKCVDLAGTIAGLLGNAFGARSVDTKSD